MASYFIFKEAKNKTMPITEDEVPGIIEAISQGKTLNEIDAFKTIADKVVLHSTEGFEKFKTNFTEEKVNEAISGRTSQIYGDIDKELDTLGFAKIGNEEKTYDRIKRLGAAHKESETTWKSEKTELMKKIDGGKGLESIKADYDQKEAEWKSEKQKYETDMNGLQTQMVNQRKSLIVSSELSSFRKQFKEGLPEAILNTHVDIVVDDVVKFSKLSEDGKTLIVLNADGSVKKNPVTFEPVVLGMELKSRLGDIIDEGKKQTGAGGQGGDPKKPTKKEDGTTDIAGLEIPETIKNRIELDDYLKDVLKLEGKEFFEASKIHGTDKKLPLR